MTNNVVAYVQIHYDLQVIPHPNNQQQSLLMHGNPQHCGTSIRSTQSKKGMSS